MEKSGGMAIEVGSVINRKRRNYRVADDRRQLRNHNGGGRCEKGRVLRTPDMLSHS